MRGSGAFRTSIVPGGALAGPWVANSLWKNARAVPSLDLRFAENKSLTDAKTGASLVTFTRASTGTYVGSDGLLQSAVTNLLLRSEEFDNASWSKDGSSVLSNSVAAPNGQLTADTLVENSLNAAHFVQSSAITATSGIAYTFSIYAKAGTRSRLELLGFALSLTGRGFDLSNGTTFANTAGLSEPSSFSIQFVGGGWYRCSITSNGNGLSSTVRAYLNNGTSYAYTGDGTSGIYLWGAQLEQSSTVGEYIPTTSTINSAPRFDHNPTTGESLGLLVEEARTNLVLRSKAIATSPWFAGANTTLTNNTSEVLDPAGGSTATKVLVSGGTGAFGQGATLTAAIHTGSIWLRCSTGTISTSLIVYLAGSPFTNIGTTSVTITTFWQRFTVVTSTATAAVYNLQLNTIAVGTVYAWGAQLEAGAFPTSYIPTTTATATRAADVASITGTNFSSWYRQDEGTVFAAGVSNGANGSGFFTLEDGSAAEYIRMGVSFSLLNFIVSKASSTQSDIYSTGTSFVFGSPFRGVAAYALNNVGLSLNGGSAQVDTTAGMPSAANALQIGFGKYSTYANGTIRRLTYWPVRLGNNVLQQITQ
jgi:hypothetical protein